LFKTNKSWEYDVPCFVHIFTPIFVFFPFYFIKLMFFKVEYTFLKIISCFSLIAFVEMSNTHFDQDTKNNLPIYYISIPIILVLLCQSIIDVYEFKYQNDPYKRLFFCLDTQFKKFSSYGNLFATLVYCTCLFYWIWILNSAEKPDYESKEVKNAMRLCLGSCIFYSLFLIERFGTYAINLFQG
jgi:hypothetical protein